MTIANKLYHKRQDIMMYEDQMTAEKSELDKYVLYVLTNDKEFNELVSEHNEVAAGFDEKMRKATEHLESLMQELNQRKQEIQTYKNYVLGHDELTSDLTKDYLTTKEKWKSSTTKYAIALDEFVNSGELKDE